MIPVDDQMDRNEMRWKYDPGERPKRKHGWGREEAGFVRRGDILIGKCPKSIGSEQAENMLNRGVVMSSARKRGRYPMRIYVVLDGVLYRAVPTRAGRSYHAFPELPGEFDKLDDELKARIWEMARNEGRERELRRWLKQVW